MTSNTLRFKVTLPTDEAGFLGRRCDSSGCGRYFKIHRDSLIRDLYCPYCGQRFNRNLLHTADQYRHLRAQAVEHAREHILGELHRVLARTARRFRGNEFVKMTYKPARYRARSVIPSYCEQGVDSELECPECTTRFQIDGIFGYCPGCRTENQLIYDANLAVILRELEENPHDTRQLRHAYNDLVSTFEAYCKKKLSIQVWREANLQDLFEARRLFKQTRRIDILARLEDSDILILRRLFQKRHAYQHNQGVIEERYVRKVPEDRKLLGQKAALSRDEFVEAARILRAVIENLVGRASRQ